MLSAYMENRYQNRPVIYFHHFFVKDGLDYMAFSHLYDFRVKSLANLHSKTVYRLPEKTPIFILGTMNFVCKLSFFSWWNKGPGPNLPCFCSGHGSWALSHFHKFMLLYYNICNYFFVRLVFECVFKILRVLEKNWQKLTIHGLGK